MWTDISLLGWETKAFSYQWCGSPLTGEPPLSLETHISGETQFDKENPWRGQTSCWHNNAHGILINQMAKCLLWKDLDQGQVHSTHIKKHKTKKKTLGAQHTLRWRQENPWGFLDSQVQWDTPPTHPSQTWSGNVIEEEDWAGLGFLV